MTSTKESAEFNVELTKSTISTLANVTVPKDTTLFKESALNANPTKPMTNTEENAPSPPVKESMNSTQLPLKLVSVFPNTLESKEYAPTAHPDTTTTATVIDVSANLASSKKEDSVILSAQVTKPTSMENANATMEFLSITANVSPLSSVLLTVNLILNQIAVCVNLDSLLLAVNVQAINTVV